VSVVALPTDGAGLRLQGIGGRVGLRVHTDAADRYIKYVTFRVDGKLIGGGVVNVPSVLVGQASLMAGRFRTLRLRQLKQRRGSVHSPPVSWPTDHELEYGDGGIIDSMFEERV